MKHNTSNSPAPATVTETALASDSFDIATAIEAKETTYSIGEGDILSRLAVIQAIHDDIAATIEADADTLIEAEALKERVNRKKSAAVETIALLMDCAPPRVIQAQLHRAYGGKIDAKGKTSKTIPAGDGEAFLKAAKAYRDVLAYVNDGTIPEAWSRGNSQRGEIAAMLDDADKAELAMTIEENSKIRVSDVVTRFFRDFTPNAAPLWMNVEKLEALREDVLVNADYLRDNPELVLAYEMLADAVRAASK